MILSVLFSYVSHWNVCIRKILMLKISVKPALLFKVIEPGLWAYVCKILCSILFSSVHSLSRVRFFATPWTAACQALLSFTISQSVLKLTSIELMIPSAISSSGTTFSSCPQSFPASESFPMSQLFASGGQGIKLQHQSFQ